MEKQAAKIEVVELLTGSVDIYDFGLFSSLNGCNKVYMSDSAQ